MISLKQFMDWVTVSNKIYNKNFPELRGRLILVNLAVMATILGISATSIYKGKGILIHTLTEGNGMPLANRTTAANGSERDQIIPLLDSIKLKTLKRGRPKKRVKVLAAAYWL